MVFLPASGLGLRDTCLAGTGSDGVLPSVGVEAFGTLAERSFNVESVLRTCCIEGRGGSAGLACGSSLYCMGGTELSPNQAAGPDGRLSCCRLSVLLPGIEFIMRLGSLRSSFSASFLLCLMASSKSTRSRHCSSNCFNES